MFRFANLDNIKVTHTSEGIIEGEVIKELPTYKHRDGRQQVGALALQAESLDALFNYLPNMFDRHHYDNSATRQGFKGFNSFGTWAECIDTYRNHPQKVRTFSPLDESLFQPQGGTEVFYDTDGSFIDMGRYMEGVPECFGENINGNVNNLFATIVINLSAMSATNVKVLQRRGERLTRLIDWLENQNIRTEVLVLHTSECVHFEAVVKRYDEPLDIDRIAVAGHPDFFRRIAFKLIEVSHTFQWGYGTATTVRDRRMNMPAIESEGITILSEICEKINEVDRVFDKCEKDLIEGLAEGNKWLSLHA